MVDPVAVQLPANQPAARFYRGGERIARFRHDEQAAPYTPEDWVASTVSVRGDAVVGLTTLPDGQLLRDAIHADPQGWLGARHIERFGADPKPSRGRARVSLAADVDSESDFGQALQLQRRICSGFDDAGAAFLSVRDRNVNTGVAPAPVAVLYHLKHRGSAGGSGHPCSSRGRTHHGPR
jgi:hypothetical protein